MPKKSTTPVTAKNESNRPSRAMADKPLNERRIALVKLMRKLGAISPESARTIEDLASNLGYTHHDVYVLTFHQYPLVSEGFVKIVRIEGERGLSFHLTKKGQSCEFDKPPFAKPVKKAAAKKESSGKSSAKSEKVSPSPGKKTPKSSSPKGPKNPKSPKGTAPDVEPLTASDSPSSEDVAAPSSGVA